MQSNFKSTFQIFNSKSGYRNANPIAFNNILFNHTGIIRAITHRPSPTRIGANHGNRHRKIQLRLKKKIILSKSKSKSNRNQIEIKIKMEESNQKAKQQKAETEKKTERK